MVDKQEELEPPYRQLQMVWPKNRLNSPPAVVLPAGYQLRTRQAGDDPGFFQVMALAGFDGWNEESLPPSLKNVLPKGWFLIVHQASGEIVATSMATHSAIEYHPFGGELGWLAGHPDHAGKGLGLAICAAVTARLIDIGYEEIFLRTDDQRLPALKTYLNLGYVPFFYAPGMAERWRVVCEQLGWPFTPDEWRQAPDIHDRG